MHALTEYLADYAAVHQNKMNKWLHMIGVPAIVIALMMFFNWIRIQFFASVTISTSWLLILACVIFYCYLSLRVAAIMAVFYVVLNAMVILIMPHTLSVKSAFTFFIFLLAGSALLAIGHFLEKDKPAFMHNILHMLIGPIVIVNAITSLFGFHLYHQNQSHDVDAEVNK